MVELAPSLKAFRAEVNARWPQRDRTSDGWIGDLAHSARVSDHNPGARDLVHAYDTDEDLDGDPANGYGDAFAIVNQLVENRDVRIKYIIYEGRIMSGRFGPEPWVWRPYSGINAHLHHVHLSIYSTVDAENDTSPWLAPKQGGTLPDKEFDMFIVRRTTDGAIALGDGGYWKHLNAAEWTAVKAGGAPDPRPVDAGQYDQLRAACLFGERCANDAKG